MKLLRTMSLFVGLLIVSACASPTIKGDPAREAQADHILTLTIIGDTESVLSDMVPGLDKTTGKAQLTVVREKLPKITPPPGKTLGYARFSGTDGDRYFITRQYSFPDEVVVTQTQMIKMKDGRWVFANFNFNMATPVELKANNLSFSDKTPVHYIMVASMVAVASFTLITAGFALYRRRWGWALFSLFGGLAFQLNWGTGAWGIRPLQFYLFGASFVRAASPFAPWIFSVAFPLGAVLFWALRKNTAKPTKAPKKSKTGRGPSASMPYDEDLVTSPTETSRPSE